MFYLFLIYIVALVEEWMADPDFACPQGPTAQLVEGASGAGASQQVGSIADASFTLSDLDAVFGKKF